MLKIAGDAIDSPDTPAAIAREMQTICDWFNAKLAYPARFNSSTSKGSHRRNSSGISWFKSTAHLQIAKAMELKRLLDELGHPITVLRAKRIGYIVWEDDHQAVAEPFFDTRT